MSQHDYVLDNQNGANFRSDLNNALAAIVTANSGASAPATIYANMWWYDTTNNALKRRNNGSTLWELWPSFDANGNMGIGVAPSAWSSLIGVDVSSSGGFFGYSAQAGITNNAYFNGTGWVYKNTAAAAMYRATVASHEWHTATSGTAGAAITFTQAMTLDASGRLLVGATSGNTAQLQVSGSSGSTNNLNSLGPGALSISSTNPASAFGVAGRLFFGAAEDSYSQFASISGIYTAYSGGAGGGIVFSTAASGGSGSITERARIDAAGNLGLSVTPTAWHPNYKAIQVNNGGVPFIAGSNSSAGSYAIFGVNSYLDSGAAWRYINSNYANKYEQYNGQHIWYIAPSGTAGAAITFTQAMTLDASGNLLVGTTSASSSNANAMTFEKPGGTSGAFFRVMHDNNAVNGSSYNVFYYNNTAIGSITQNGTNAVAYNTTSDHRLKTNVRPADAKKFNDIQFVDFEWIDGRHDCGVIADQLQSVYPDLVLGEKDAVDEEGNPVYQQVNYMGLIARMGTRSQAQDKAIQELAAELAAVKAQLHYLVKDVQELAAELAAVKAQLN